MCVRIVWNRRDDLLFVVVVSSAQTVSANELGSRASLEQVMGHGKNMAQFAEEGILNET